MLKRAALVLALLLVSCGGDAPKLRPPIAATTPDVGHVQKTVHANLEMEVTGAENVKFKAPTKLRIVEILGGRTPTITWFVSVSIGEVLLAPDGREVLFTADLAPGLYNGAGTYSLQPKPTATSSPVPASGGSSIFGSAAYVSFLTLPPKPLVARYDRILAPCTLKVEKDVVSGSVHCPKLKHEKTEATVALRWSWELT